MKNKLSDSEVSTNYRRDIQSLRGVAVLMVVAYHSKLAIPGGFTGVDIFFVISGYVISQHIVHEQQISRFSIRSFYEKRILRLIPILAVVNITTVLFALIVFDPFGEIQQVTEAVRYSNFFSANLFFFLSNNYLDLENHPLRHLWSLGVEEQFYFFFPFLLLVLIRVCKNKGKLLFLFLFATSISISLILCLYLTEFQSNSRLIRLAFYGTPLRGWEFLAGSLSFFLVKFQMIPKKRLSTDVINTLGLVLLVLSSFAITSTYSFPNASALIPVLGTCLLVVSGGQSGMLSKIYSNVVFEKLGNVSYGWYLWHWPFIVYAERIFSSDTQVLVLASIASLFVAIVTYLLIEQPIRYSANLRGKRAWVVLAVCMGASFIAVFAVDKSSETGLGLYRDQDENILVALNGCFSVSRDGQFPNTCDNGVEENGNSIMLLGDSQAESAADGLYQSASELGVRVLGYGAAGCPMRSTSTIKESGWCPKAQDFYLSAVITQRPRLVVIANRYDEYVIQGSDSSTADIRIPFADGRIPMNKQQQIQSMVESLIIQVKLVRETGAEVAILLDTPNVVMPAFTVLSKQRGHTDYEIKSVTQDNEVRDEIISQIRIQLSNAAGVTIIDPQRYLCDEYPVCFADIGGRYSYWEQQHLNRNGSLLLVPLWKSVISGLYKGE
jgi:peptidoglycan/LPS O-acetylase OafA/YrhL